MADTDYTAKISVETDDAGVKQLEESITNLGSKGGTNDLTEAVLGRFPTELADVMKVLQDVREEMSRFGQGTAEFEEAKTAAGNLEKELERLENTVGRLPPIIDDTADEFTTLEKAAKKAKSEIKVVGEESGKTGGSLKKIEGLQVAAAFTEVLNSSRAAAGELVSLTEQLKNSEGGIGDLAGVANSSIGAVTNFASAVKGAKAALGPIGIALVAVTTALELAEQVFKETATEAEKTAEKEREAADKAYEAAKQRRAAAELSKEAAELAQDAVKQLTEDWDENVRSINDSTAALKQQVSAQNALLDDQVQLALTKIRTNKNLTEQQKLEATIAVKNKAREIKQSREQRELDNEIAAERAKREDGLRVEEQARDVERLVPDAKKKNEEERRQIQVLEKAKIDVEEENKAKVAQFDTKLFGGGKFSQGLKRKDFETDEEFLKANIKRSKEELKGGGKNGVRRAIQKKAIQVAEAVLKRTELPKQIDKLIAERNQNIAENDATIKAGEEAPKVIAEARKKQEDAVRKQRELEAKKAVSQKSFAINSQTLDLSNNFELEKAKEAAEKKEAARVEKARKKEEGRLKKELAESEKSGKGFATKGSDIGGDIASILKQGGLGDKPSELGAKLALEQSLKALLEGGITNQEVTEFLSLVRVASKLSDTTSQQNKLMRAMIAELRKIGQDADIRSAQTARVQAELTEVQNQQKNGGY